MNLNKPELHINEIPQPPSSITSNTYSLISSYYSYISQGIFRFGTWVIQVIAYPKIKTDSN